MQTHQRFTNEPTKLSPFALTGNHAVVSVENRLKVCIPLFCAHEHVEPLRKGRRTCEVASR